ncbi:hypothetical protein PVAG01_07240 [Phlyctema vagabunda]|uniref:FAM192A/Fyv6 N-terminal domain-containing protein n=1 Tax=Phlyctema vagabunda TaxID=108571 RepID=A0ABR4PBV2_9HELO
MSSGFVSGGTTDAPIERSDEWLAAQQELEANRARKAAEARQSDGRSLFETLEANKAAKQDAFEEANRLKHQFRALDEDEAEFLDSVLERTRADEDRIKKETAEGLALFRRQQDEADKQARATEGLPEGVESPVAAEEQWVAGGRKRKRTKEKEVLKGVKIRRTSSTTSQRITPTKANATPTSSKQTSGLAAVVKSIPSSEQKGPTENASATPQKQTIRESSTTNGTLKTDVKKDGPPATSGLGLVAYGSDDDSD